MGDDKEKEGEEELYRVQTVPPPAGETDAYNAPTKVGPMASAVIGEIIEHAKRKGGVVEVIGTIKEPHSDPKDVKKPPPKVQPKTAADINATRKIPSAKIPAVTPDALPESQPIRPMAVINVADESTDDAVLPPPGELPSFPEAPSPRANEEIKTPPIAVADVQNQLGAALDPDALAAQVSTPMPLPAAPLAAPPTAPTSSPAPVAAPEPAPISHPQPASIPQPMTAAPASAPAKTSPVRVVVLLVILLALVVAAVRLFIRK